MTSRRMNRGSLLYLLFVFETLFVVPKIVKSSVGPQKNQSGNFFYLFTTRVSIYLCLHGFFCNQVSLTKYIS